MSGTKDDDVLRVSTTTNPQTLASAIAHAIYEHSSCTLRAVGAGATNQAMKAIAIARGYAAPRGYDLVCVPAFQNVESNGATISAMVIKVKTIN